MPSAESIKQFLVGVVLPPIAGIVVTAIVANVHVLNLFHISETQLSGWFVSMGTWGITTLIAFLTTHHILSGHWVPSAVKHAQALELATARTSTTKETTRPEASKR